MSALDALQRRLQPGVRQSQEELKVFAAEKIDRAGPDSLLLIAIYDGQSHYIIDEAPTRGFASIEYAAELLQSYVAEHERRNGTR